MTGIAGYLLTMTGNQNRTAIIMMISAMANIILNVLLILMIGINGAAISTLISTIIMNVLMYYLSIKRVGIDPTILAYFKNFNRTA